MAADSQLPGQVVEIDAVASDMRDRLADEIAHRQWERCFQSAVRGICIVNTESDLIERVNVAFAQIHGGEVADFVGMHIACLCRPDESATVNQRARVSDCGEAIEFEAEHVRLDGSSFPVKVELISVPAELDQRGYLIGWVCDLSAQRETERAARDANARFETAFANAPVGMALVGLDGRWIKINDAVAKLTGYSPQELLQLRFQDITHPDDLKADLELVRQTIAGEIPGYEMEKRYITKQGQVVWIRLSVSMMREENGAPSYFISQIQDISAYKQTEQRLRRLADRDPLTDLWNRRRFEEELSRQVARCKRYGEHAALLMIDLDQFKQVNDTHGHKMGDSVIVAVAGLLRDRLRSGDSVARIGGDEFAMLLVNAGAEDALAVVAELRTALAALVVRNRDRTSPVTASIGLATLDGNNAASSDPLVRADQAMYRAKAAGRDRVAR